jgi:outer membrane protein assembly factor BamB
MRFFSWRRPSLWIAILSLIGVLLLFVLHFRKEYQHKKNSPSVQIVWLFEPAERGGIVSSPLVVGDRIYAGAIHDVGFSTAGAVYCLDRFTGKKLWKFDDDERMQHMFSSPCIADGRLYIGEGMHQNFQCKLYCLDADSGTKLWDFEVGNHIESSPCVVDGKVFFGAGDDGVYCLDAKTGKPCWHFQELLHVDSSPAAVGGLLFAGSGLSRKCKTTEVFCLNSQSGTVVWRRPTRLSAWGSPVVDGNQVLFGLGNARMMTGAAPSERPAGAVWCLKADSGQIIWQWSAPDAVMLKPVVDDRYVYVEARDGFCYCLDRKQGTECWKADFGSPIIARPALADGHLYVVSGEGRMGRLDAGTGKIEWTFDVASYYQTKPRMFSSPTVLRDSKTEAEHHWIYVGSELSNPAGNAAVLFAFRD